LQSVNLSVSPDDAKALADGISKGGQDGFALALFIATMVAEAEPAAGSQRGSGHTTFHLPH
jgi:hypothetical protein